MTSFALFLNTTLAVGTLAALAAAGGIFILLFSKKTFRPMHALFHYSGLWLAFSITLVAAIGSLLYSEAVGFLPCILCWYQRVALFPQVILFGIAAKRRDFRVVEYALPLSFIGALIAAYHYYGQMVNVSALPCPTIAGLPSCSQVPFVAFGFITIPMMALSVFVLLIALSLFLKKYSRV